MDIKEYIKQNILYLDGGTGTVLFECGLKAGEKVERWNITHRKQIVSLHKAYFDSDSNVVCTNTFGANLLNYSYAELDEIIGSAVQNAREAQRTSVSSAPKWVALDIGPSGKMLEPYGELGFEQAVEIFAQTVKLGVKYGVDLIMIETMNDSYETKAALLAAKENSSLPVFVSNAYGEDGKLVTGASAEAMVAMLEGMGADAIGVNCSLGPKALGSVVKKYLEYSSLPVILKPNAGLPCVVDGKTVYDTGADEWASEVCSLLDSGVAIVGGCCGTSPEYIAGLVKRSADKRRKPTEKKNYCIVSSYTHAVEIGSEPVLIGERINPTGKKRFKQALIEGDIEYILNEGIKQQDKGVHILDVNVGLPDIDEPSVLCSVVKQLQAVSDLPLQIDSSNAVAMEKALRLYNGKALINSVSGKEESMREIFPLAQKYGGVVIALTLDERGIPTTAEGRVEIAKKILNRASEYGLGKKDIIFDPLALTISADDNAAKETLRAVKLISGELGCKTSLGVSNISFGLPRRELINSTFFALALSQGLSVAIMNPFCNEMMSTYFAFRALGGMDKSCKDYINYAQTLPEVVEKAVVKTEIVENKEGSGLTSAIVKGFREQAASLTEKLLESKDGLEIINTEIIPALNVVGEGFENKTVYLPQLLTSAEAAKSAFAKIKEKMPESKKGKCAFVLATVKGDIHDIGKNIVKLLLENYGFDVIDLGKDVEPRAVLDEVIKVHAPLVGLSALMTTTVPAMEETIALIRESAPWCKVVVGGAVLNADYAKKIGADKYAKDGMETVRYAEQVFGQLN